MMRSCSFHSAAAPSAAWLIPRAPWLPPMMSSVLRCGSGWKPKLASARARSIFTRRLARIGVPVTWQRVAARKYFAHSENPRSTVRAMRALRRLALPGMAFDSWTKVGSPSRRPAKMGAVEVNPPMPSTASG